MKVFRFSCAQEKIYSLTATTHQYTRNLVFGSKVTLCRQNTAFKISGYLRHITLHSATEILRPAELLFKNNFILIRLMVKITIFQNL